MHSACVLFSLLAIELFLKLDFRTLRNYRMSYFADEKCLSEQQLAQGHPAHKGGLGWDAKGPILSIFLGQPPTVTVAALGRCDSVSLISTSISVPESHWCVE